MRQSTRLILNTLITYARMGLTVGIGLLVTRKALALLGEGDFGLLATLGASGALLLILSDSLTASMQRHLAYEIGKENTEALRAVFNTALAIFGVAGPAVFLVGAAIWPLLRPIVDVPEGSENAVTLVFMLTLGNIVAATLATPFRAYLMARQSFGCVAVYETAQSVLALVAVLLLTMVENDRLAVYAWLILGARVGGELIAVLAAVAMFPDCRPRPWLVRRDQIGRIASFAGWSLVAQMAWRIRVQGSTIIVNSFYGARVSAAYGVASQLGGYQNQVGAAVWRAVRPAMATIEGRGGVQGVKDLTLVSSKYLLLLTLFILVPFELEMEALLDLWLKEVPEHTAIVTRLVLVWMAMFYASQGYQFAMEAKGSLGRYAMIMAVFDLAVVLTQLAFLWAMGRSAGGQPVIGPWLVPAITLAIIALQNVARAWYVGTRIDIPLSRWFAEVLWPTMLVAAIAGGAAATPMLLMEQGWVRLLVTTGVFGVVALPTIWLLGMRRWEREHFTRVASSGVGLAMRLSGRALAREKAGAEKSAVEKTE
ncbi:MAG: hypothetical protein KDA05_10570 [Phycisphaerales bacterium]|nr:hypothetical protein [Phycisphaerales bacterium]MCB9840939.1 hypothetical protein [Phycisphaeraceae bacterium]